MTYVMTAIAYLAIGLAAGVLLGAFGTLVRRNSARSRR